MRLLVLNPGSLASELALWITMPAVRQLPGRPRLTDGFSRGEEDAEDGPQPMLKSLVHSVKGKKTTIPSEGVYILIAGILHGKRDSRDVIKVKDLEIQ